MKKDIYEIYTEQIIALLESGTAPWRKPWAGGAAGMPRNLKTGKAYRGINTLMLALRGYASPNWLTFKQAKELGGKVRKGEKSTIVLFFNWIYKTADGKRAKSAADAATKHGFYKYYRVFNIEQIDGIESPEPVKPVREHEAIAECEAVVDNMPQRPVINHGGGRADYRPSTDAVQMPPAATFGSGEGYYCVLFHEPRPKGNYRVKLVWLCGLFARGTSGRDDSLLPMWAHWDCRRDHRQLGGLPRQLD